MTPSEFNAAWLAWQRECPSLWRVPRLGGTRCVTIGPLICTPHGFEAQSLGWQYSQLAHEMAHVRQYMRCGFGNPWLGIPVFLLCYLLVPLPIGLAWFRYHWEREAFAAEEAARQVAGFSPRRDIPALLSGSAYGWSWPRRWIRGL